MSQVNTSQFLDSASTIGLRKNYTMLESTILEDGSNTIRYTSPVLRMGKIKSVQFNYKSPSKVQRILTNQQQLHLTNSSKQFQPCDESRQVHKLVVRRLPKFNHQIYDDEPQKYSKIIQNIVYLRQTQKNNQQLLNPSLSRVKSNTVIVNNQVEISKIPIDLKDLKQSTILNIQNDLKLNKVIINNSNNNSSSKILASSRSRANITQEAKFNQELFNSAVKQYDQPKTPVKALFGLGDKIKEQYLANTNTSKNNQDSNLKVELGESSYFSRILGN